MFAARNGHEEVVARLLKAGANLDLKNDQGETAESWGGEISQHRHCRTDRPQSARPERPAAGNTWGLGTRWPPARNAASGRKIGLARDTVGLKH